MNKSRSELIPKKTQVLVIGGGPSGSSVATLLAKQGIGVVLLEKDVFPRYHIGESLLPSALTFFDLLGVREKMENYGFKLKQGAYLEWGKDKWKVDFTVLGDNRTYSFQVKRAEFDYLLLEHSKETGVDVFEGISVEKVVFENGRANRVTWKDITSGAPGELFFDYLVDASGRNGLIGTKYNKDRKIHPEFQNVAVWGYWKNVNVPSHVPQGAISVISTHSGWFWAIPLHDDTMSIGIVLHKNDFKRQKTAELGDLYHKVIGQNEYLKRMTEGADFQGEVKAEQDYSYSSGSFCGPGYFICGDAACFIDPLLSSGVHLAMFSAVLAAASISSLIGKEVSEKEGLNYYQKCYKKAYLRIMVFVSSFYNQNNGMESHFWKAKKLINSNVDEHDLKYAFTSLISGVEDIEDIDGQLNDFVNDEMLKRIKEKTANAKAVAMLRERGDVSTATDDNTKFFFGNIEGVFAFNEQEAIDGLYIISDGGVKLRRLATD